MRLRQNKSNYRARGLIKRDAKHSHGPPDAPRPTRAKKDRKRWCGGHEGREHTPKCMDYVVSKGQAELQKKHPGIFGDWKVLVCTTCGKELDSYMPWDSVAYPRPKPAWLVEEAT